MAAQRKMAEARKSFYQGDRATARKLSQEALKIDPHVLSLMDEAVLVSEDEAAGKTLMVLPFANISQRKEDNWLTLGVQEALITDLKKIAGLYMVERSQIKEIMQEHDFSCIVVVTQTVCTLQLCPLVERLLPLLPLLK